MDCSECFVELYRGVCNGSNLFRYRFRPPFAGGGGRIPRHTGGATTYGGFVGSRIDSQPIRKTARLLKSRPPRTLDAAAARVFAMQTIASTRVLSNQPRSTRMFGSGSQVASGPAGVALRRAAVIVDSRSRRGIRGRVVTRAAQRPEPPRAFSTDLSDNKNLESLMEREAQPRRAGESAGD